MRKIDWKQINAEALLITNPKNIRHFTNLNASLAFLLIKKDSRTLFTDSRYFEVAKEVYDGEVKLFKNMEQLEKEIKGIESLAIESDFITINQVKIYKKMIKNLVYINGQKLRMIKQKDEIDNLREAIKITKDVMEWASKKLKPGLTEKELSIMVVSELKRRGSEDLDYQPIIAGGENSSKPHAKPSERKFKNGDTVMFDFAAVINGYTADLTRNYSIGKITNKEIIKIKEIVKKSQMAGIKAVKPGIIGSEIDKICREIIEKEGYGSMFGHGTGHGLGRDVHEFPNVGPSSDIKFVEGNVITVEPGIYLPGIGGIRIEDDILVTKDGFEIL